MNTINQIAFPSPFVRGTYMKVASPWKFGPIWAHLVNCSDGLLCRDSAYRIKRILGRKFLKVKNCRKDKASVVI